MKLLGYSERGFINALLYEIAYRQPGEAQELVKKLFQLIKWPCLQPSEEMFNQCNTILVEQSFSDFGDADGLFFFTNGEDGAAVFLEVKRGEDYTLNRAWKKFIGSYWSRSGPRGLTSNLFCQIYFKQRLATALRFESGEDADQGLSFEPPFDLRDRMRKTGDNHIVRKSVEVLRKHLGKVYYVLMVPERWTDDLKSWWEHEVAATNPAPIGWDVSCWGILTIPEIVEFCKENKLSRTLDVVGHNEGQLFVETGASGSSDVVEWLNAHGKRGVTVIYAPQINKKTSLHFSWAGNGCVLRDYSEATPGRPPKPKRETASKVVQLIERFERFVPKNLGIENTAEWRRIIEQQNALWRIGDCERP